VVITQFIHSRPEYNITVIHSSAGRGSYFTSVNRIFMIKENLPPNAETTMKRKPEHEPERPPAPASSKPSAGLGDIAGFQLPSWRTLEGFRPLHRVLLTANGNLQRLMSSYYNSPVTVKVRVNRRVARGEYEREVDLSVHGLTFAIAVSKVRLGTDELISAVEERGLAIGQLFRHMSIMPTFELRDAGAVDVDADLARKAGDDGAALASTRACFYREYTLDGKGVSCEIYEIFRRDCFELPGSNGGLLRDSPTPASDSSAPTMGDIMAPNVTFMRLPDGFTPDQRMLLTANGNVERILSSFYCKPVQLYVSLHHKRSSAHVYDRQAALFLEGKQLMLAKSTVYVTSDEWASAVDACGGEVGGLFRHFSELPTFSLHSAGSGPGYFWRQYSLKASGMSCEINETFSSQVFSLLDDTVDEPSRLPSSDFVF
jgi:hypothetical protein